MTKIKIVRNQCRMAASRGARIRAYGIWIKEAEWAELLVKATTFY